MKSDAWRLALTGLSLTSVMAAALFVMVALNPKDASYGSTPLVYAALSAALAVVFNRAAAWVSPRNDPSTPG
ncbi:MAG: hypothetical protein RLZZ440_1741 [Planctomycetota bacterium]|jgi:hypothetical protein